MSARKIKQPVGDRERRAALDIHGTIRRHWRAAAVELEKSRTTDKTAFASSDWIGEVEAALALINEAEGCLMIGKKARGMAHLACGKKMLEEIVDSEPRPSPSEKDQL